MGGTEYLLDANIVIRIWNEYPNMLDTIENTEGIDFKISQEIAAELCKKEFNKINNLPVLSNRFIKLLGHIIDKDIYSEEEAYIQNHDIKYRTNNKVYFVNGDKISENDYILISICEKHREYILVTEDKKILQIGKHILDDSRVIKFQEFIDQLRRLNSL